MPVAFTSKKFLEELMMPNSLNYFKEYSEARKNIS